MPQHWAGFAFLRALLRTPRQVGAIAPSSRHLAETMAASLEVCPNRATLELGPGTGVVTEALLAAGVPAHRLVAVEQSDVFVRALSERFPGVELVQGDVFDIKALLPPRIRAEIGGALSSLPLLTFPIAKRQRLYEDIFDLMKPGARLIQFTYRPAAPVPTEGTNLVARRCGRSLRNLPPAWVWCYHRPEIASAATAAC